MSADLHLPWAISDPLVLSCPLPLCLLPKAAPCGIVLGDHVVGAAGAVELGPPCEGVGGLVPALAEVLRADGRILSVEGSRAHLGTRGWNDLERLNQWMSMSWVCK